VKLENTFTVPVTADVAWQVLLDVERIAPCMPGATLTGRDGDSFTGNVKVKVGPISLTYGGTASFASLDEANHVAVIEAAGKETRGSGTAKAVITARMHEHDGSTEVAVETELTITGKPAQFGRGVMAEISGKLITAFADCLAAEITSDGASVPTAAVDTPTAQSSEASGPAEPADKDTDDTSPAAAAPPPQSTPSDYANKSRPTPEAIDLLGTAGLPVLKRIAPIALGLFVLLGLILLRRRRA
jgi:carbon monoxide dehydrogenase subunit G